MIFFLCEENYLTAQQSQVRTVYLFCDYPSFKDNRFFFNF